MNDLVADGTHLEREAVKRGEGSSACYDHVPKGQDGSPLSRVCALLIEAVALVVECECENPTATVLSAYWPICAADLGMVNLLDTLDQQSGSAFLRWLVRWRRPDGLQLQ